jgi:hypothetical protein
LLIIAIGFPFGLAYLASRPVSSSMYIVKRQITIVFRTSLIGRWGICIQMFRRLIMVLIHVFTQVPETVSTPFSFSALVGG